MKIDLIIPTYKPDRKFDALIKEIKKQTIKPNHTYIINTEEKYFPKEVVASMPDVTVKHISKEEFDHGGTRNSGAELADEDTDILMFMTQDAVPCNNKLIEEMLKPFEDSQVSAVYARQMVREEDNPMEYYTRLFNYPEEDRKKTKDDLEELGIKTFFCSNVCAAYRKSEYEKLGGFVLKTILNEDMMMAADMIQDNKAVYYAAKANVWHWHNYSARKQMKRNFDIAVSQVEAGGIFLKVKSEKEGIRLVKETCKYMIKTHRFFWLFKVIWQSGFKFIGYRLGKSYQKLPMWLVKRISMNPKYFEKNEKYIASEKKS